MTREVGRWLDPGAGLPEGGLVFRPSARAALVPVLNGLLGLGAAALLGTFAGLAAGLPILPSLLASFALSGPFALFAFVGLLAPIVQVLTSRYVLHEDGLTVRAQFLSKNEQRVEWAKVTALVHRRGLMDGLLGIERLDVVAYGAKGTTLRLVGLRPAAPVRDHVARRMRERASVAALFEND